MTRMKKLRDNAPILLEAVKEAIRFIQCLDIDTEEKNRVLQALYDAVKTADASHFDKREMLVKLMMTPRTWESLHTAVEKLSRQDPEHYQDVVDLIKENVQQTKQRTYLFLPINITVLRKLEFILRHTHAPRQDHAFKRLAREIREQGIDKNPLELIASMGI